VRTKHIVIPPANVSMIHREPKEKYVL